MTRLIAFVLLPLIYAASCLAAEDLPDDQRLVDRISSAFADKAEYEDALVQVHSVRGFILLTGQVTNEEARSGATNTVVFASQDIRRITNELLVVDVVNSSSAETDATLQAAIVADLQSMDAALADKVTVVTHRAVVYLMGALSAEEQQQVAKRVAGVPGVASIKTVFETIQVLGSTAP